MEIPLDMNNEKVGDLVEAMIGELFITYPEGFYEKDYPWRALWNLPSMATATSTDKAVLRLLEFVAVVQDMAFAMPCEGSKAIHAWVATVLPVDNEVKQLVDQRGPRVQGQKAVSALKSAKKKAKEAAWRAQKKAKLG